MKKEEVTALLKYFKKLQEGTLEDNIAEIKKIMLLLQELIEGLSDAKVKIESWQYHIQTLANKNVFTSYSILKLIDGFTIEFYKKKDLKIEVIDYQSIFILTRALIESYLTLIYIYHNDLSNEEKIFRYKLWEVSGLILRQNLSSSNEAEIIKIKKEEKLLIEKALKEIEKMPEYNTLDKRKLYKLETIGLPKIDSWNKIISNSSLNNDLFLKAYSYFSSYAHSEFLSILQLRQMSINKSSPINISNIKLALNLVMIINCLFVDFYVKNFASAGIVFNTFPSVFTEKISVGVKIGTSRSLD